MHICVVCLLIYYDCTRYRYTRTTSRRDYIFLNNLFVKLCIYIICIVMFMLYFKILNVLYRSLGYIKVDKCHIY